MSFSELHNLKFKTVHKKKDLIVDYRNKKSEISDGF